MEAIFQHERNETDDFYKILNCSEHSSAEQINTEYKVLALECHPDKNPHDPTAVERFAKLQRAKDVLCDAKTRKKYDQWMNSGVAMSYDQWCGLRDSVQTSMHWASVKTQPMLDHPDHPVPTPQTSRQPGSSSYSTPQSTPSSTFGSVTKETKSAPWERDPASDVLSKFRNYEI